ncbi:MAG: DMT family transporter [Limnohabitans sp.]|uniref:DMT family transporter n=1 Tax=Limnohabitans sp. TaxID=1907725 RepID=UPI003BAFB485
MNQSVTFAIAAAVLFGASTPLSKMLVGDVSPVLLGGLLYLGSGVGLGLFRMLRDKGWKPSGIQAREWPWLLGAIFFGGVLGPVALMYGLTTVSGSAASLMLNLESVLTALLAWMVFKENADKRIVLGMVAIVAGGAVLTWQPVGAGSSSFAGLAAIGIACLCWAIDNNLTRKVSASDAVFIASSKGLLAGLLNSAVAIGIGGSLPTPQTTVLAMVVGLLGYGISLVFFVLALRGLGTARTGAYFSTAPFIGSAVSLLFLGETATPLFWIASALMGLGVWLHMTETHEHEHTHTPLEHTHAHTHDEHHQHQHNAETNLTEPHLHWHRHSSVTHKHPHYPDIHHQHSH